MFIVPDFVQIYLLEKRLKRALTEEERCGERAIRLKIKGTVKYIRVQQVNLLWIHNSNNFQ